MFLFYSEDHPDSPPGDLNGWYDQDNDIGFHGDSSDDIRGDVEHPYKPENKIKENDSIVNFFVPVNKFLSQVSIFGIKKSPVVPDVHVVGERSRGEGSKEPNVEEIVVVWGLVFTEIGGDHSNKA